MHRDRLSVKHSGREDDPILFPNGERERGEIATRPSSSVDASFPRAKTNELCRRNNSYSLGKDDLWTVQFDAIAISSSFPSLAESRFLISLPFSPHLSTTKQPTRCPVHLLILSRGNLSRLFFLSSSYYWKLYLLAMFLSFSLSRYLSLSRLILRVGKIAVSILSPSELYTRYIMNIVISRRSYTVRSFLKWKSTGKVGRGLRVTFHLLDPPALESSYRLSRLSSITSSVAFATVTYFTSSIAFLFFFHSFLLFLFSSLLLLLK